MLSAPVPELRYCPMRVRRMGGVERSGTQPIMSWLPAMMGFAPLCYASTHPTFTDHRQMAAKAARTGS